MEGKGGEEERDEERWTREREHKSQSSDQSKIFTINFTQTVQLYLNTDLRSPPSTDRC